MISERSQYFFHPGSMDRYKLDSNVVQVKLNGKEIYCDPGSAFTPFGLLPWPETSVLGRLLDSNGGAWVHTTLPEANESRIERSAKMKLTEIGDLEGKLTVTYSGLEAVRRRVEERNEDDTDKKKYLEDEVKDYIAAASELELTNRPDWRSSTQPLVAEFSLKVPGWASSAGRRALVSVGLFSAAEKHLFDHTDRVHPIYFEYPFEKIDDVTVELPSGWQVSSVPPAKNQEGRVVSYSLSVENGRNTVHLHRKLSVDVLLLETKYYPALRNFFQMVRTGDEEQVVLQPGTAVATQ
jgi:hypothetical protein